MIYELADPFSKNDWPLLLLWLMYEIVFQDLLFGIIIIYICTNKGTIKAEKVVLRIGIYQPAPN